MTDTISSYTTVELELCKAQHQVDVEWFRRMIEGLHLVGDNPYGALWGAGWEGCIGLILEKLRSLGEKGEAKP